MKAQLTDRMLQKLERIERRSLSPEKSAHLVLGAVATLALAGGVLSTALAINTVMGSGEKSRPVPPIDIGGVAIQVGPNGSTRLDQGPITDVFPDQATCADIPAPETGAYEQRSGDLCQWVVRDQDGKVLRRGLPAAVETFIG